MNPDFNWLLLTDDRQAFEYPGNVQVKYILLQDVAKLADSKFGFHVKLDEAYKLCDFKPAYGYIFEEYIKEYEFWGHCDIDIILGKISHFLTREILDRYDKFFCIHDAIEAGFNKIVFIIRKDIKDAFKEAIGDCIEKICKDLDVEIAYAYQELNELPEGVEHPAERTKPWGTGQAVLACKEVLHEPFAVINADDYYGKEAFVKLHDFLVGYTPEKANQFCMAGFILKNTLSENGAVTRGICETNEEGYLTAVHETSNIVKTPEGAAVDNDGQLTSINAESYASMNMWGLTPEFMQTLEDGFKEFFANMGNKDIMKAEYLLPIYIDELLQAGRVSVKVLDTNDKWFGVTYKEDKDYVVKSFANLIEAGVYQKDLFEDLK